MLDLHSILSVTLNLAFRSSLCCIFRILCLHLPISFLHNKTARLQTYPIINMYRRSISRTPSHSFLALLSPAPRRVFYIYILHSQFSICLHERVAAIFIPPLEINPPATRALFVHLEANVRSRGIIHDPVNINKCIFLPFHPYIFIFLSPLIPSLVSLSLSSARGDPLLFPLRCGDARALMRAFTRACYLRGFTNG